MKFEDIHNLMQKPEVKPDTYEAGMALNQLLKIGTHAIKIHNMIDDDAEMEAWVAKKIDLASNYVKSVHGYTAGEKAGTYDDAGLTEDAGDIGNEIAKIYDDVVAYLQDVSDNPSDDEGDLRSGYDSDDVNDAEDLAAAFRKDLKTGMALRKQLQAEREKEGERRIDVWDPFNPESKHYDQLKALMPNHKDESVSEDAGDDWSKVTNALIKKYGEDKAKAITDYAQMGTDSAEELMKSHGLTHKGDGKDEERWFQKYPWLRQLANKSWMGRLKDIAGEGPDYGTPVKMEDAGEGHMSKSQLYQTAKMAIELLDMIKKGDDLEGWVQTKLNLAADYLQAVYHYEDYQKLNPYREEIDSDTLHRHAGIIQKHLDEILERKCRAEDVDTKPGMMRILKKRVNEVEKELAKKGREHTNESVITEDPRAVGRALANLKYAKAMANGIIKGDDMVLLRPKAQAFLSSADETIELLDKMYAGPTNEDAHLEEGMKEWAKKLAMAGVIVAGLAGIGSVNDAINNSVPAVKAMNTALEMAEKAGNDELAKMIEKDLRDAKVRLDSGRDLPYVKDLQDKYAKFMTTEGLNFESRLQIKLSKKI